MNLPREYEETMRELLQDQYELYIDSLKEEYVTGIRINSLKITTGDFEKISPYSITSVPWTKNGYYYHKKEQPAKHPYYYAGLYYIQEPSAMVPAALFEIKPGDKVLDLCAAPGGKSTELAAKLRGKGVLITNDISNSRAKALLKNIELFGVTNAIVMSEDPKKLVKYFEGYFDKILIDAPCSGEGMFRKEPTMIKNWEEYGVDYYSKIQKEIILYAAKMLKPGGLLCFSTCTFSPKEDEGTIQFLLEECPEYTVEKMEAYELFDSGKPEWIDSSKATKELGNCIRLWPWKVKGEGHFLAILRKKQEQSSFNGIQYNLLKFKRTEEFLEFLSHVKIPFDSTRLECREDRVYYLPEGLVDMKGLRILRSGLYLGDLKKKRFEPSQALANALKMDEYDKSINLSSKDSNVIKYLKGETLEVESGYEDGWNLICVDGFPLGWGKLYGTTLKNKLYPGWRWLS